jgi:hypothetical protein
MNHLSLQKIMLPGVAVSSMTTQDINTIGARQTAASTGYWMARISQDSSTNFRGISSRAGATYVNHDIQDEGGIKNFAISKFNSANGTYQWTVKIPVEGNQTNGVTCGSVKTDANGNCYAVFNRNDGTNSGQYYLFKISPNGVLIWDREVGNTTYNQYVSNLSIDGSDNIFLAGRSSTASGTKGFVAKFNTDGTLQWQKYHDIGDNEYDASAADASGNFYGAGYTNITSGYQSGLVSKINSAGALQWSRSWYASSGATSQTRSVAVDSTLNVYSNTYFGDASGQYGWGLRKYNSSGTLQWERRLYQPSQFTIGQYGCVVDSSDNVYFSGYYSTNSNDALYQTGIAKYNSSGTLQWQRALQVSTYTLGQELAIDSNNDIYHVFNGGASGSSAPLDLFIAKLPSDGSKTGTYTVGGMSVVYSTTSMTDAATSYTTSTTSGSLVDGDMTVVNNQFTPKTPTGFTVSQTNI